MFDPTAPLGRAIRLPLRLIPKSAVLPVLSGPNRGRRWIVGAGTNACWLGRYERSEIAWFVSRFGPADIVWDIGAHAGFFTLACAPRCREVVACEPLASNLAFLARHVAINRLANVRIVDAALTDVAGARVSFGGSSSSYQNRIGGEDAQASGQTVRTETVDHLVQAGLPPPSIVKMDVEGAEAAVLRGALSTIARHRPRLMVAVHGAHPEAECRDLLGRNGYDVTSLNIGTIWATPRP